MGDHRSIFDIVDQDRGCRAAPTASVSRRVRVIRKKTYFVLLFVAQIQEPGGRAAHMRVAFV
jgi:hypothetical protein